MWGDPWSRTLPQPTHPYLMKRSDFLKCMAAAGAASAIPLDRLNAKPRPVTPEDVTCWLTPSETEGPYYVNANLVRQNITEGRAGAPLQCVINVVDENCSPIPNVMVDIWHCDKDGVYSGYAGQLGGLDTTGQTFMRGIQFTNANGQVTFQTIYPGWYPGRAVHVHFKVRTSGTTYVTGQWCFDDGYTTGVYAAHPTVYTHAGTRTLNTGDGIFGNTALPQYEVMTVNGDGNGGYTGTFTIGVNAPVQSVLLTPKVLLEGPLDSASGIMADALRAAGLVPLTEPYTAAGWPNAGGGGETTNLNILGTTGNNAIVDWVRVELRSSTTPSTLVAARHALLQRDGDIVSAADGSSAVSLPEAPGSYHVAIRHRNHMGCMTASPVALSGTATALDFRSAALATWGTNARKTVGTNLALRTGNAYRDGNVNQLKYTGSTNDRDPLLTRVGSTTPNNAAAGYYPEDVNMDGTTKFTGTGNDRDPILVNVGATTPNNIVTEQVP